MRRQAFLVLGDEGDAVELEDTAAIQAVADPLRVRILRRLAEPASAKELAADLERPVTSLYHHLDLLEEHGLIRVVDVHKDGRSLVRRYQRSGNRFESAVRRVTFAVGDDAGQGRFRLVLRGRLDPERIEELRGRVLSLVREFVQPEDGPMFEVSVTVAPMEEEADR